MSESKELDLKPIKQRIGLAQRMFGVSFDGYPDIDRDPVDIQRDRDRSALLREVERLRSLPSPPSSSDTSFERQLEQLFQDVHLAKCLWRAHPDADMDAALEHVLETANQRREAAGVPPSQPEKAKRDKS